MTADVALVRVDEGLPDDPSALSHELIAARCRGVYESREWIVAEATIDWASDELRKAKAIEQLVASREHKDEARRAARVLETAVGEALGDGPGAGARTDLLTSPRAERLISEQDIHRFRLMAAHRDLWWPVLAEKALSRNQVLTMIAETVEAKVAQELTGRTARAILGDCMEIIDNIGPVDLLIADPPYFTDGDFTPHISACLKRVKPTGQAYIFASADPVEVAAYLATDPGHMILTQMLAWNYNNTGQRQPNERYTSNYQVIFYYRGPDAPPMNKPSDGKEQYACQTINAPDGRQGDRWHKWQKPLELINRIIRNSTKEGDFVFDPFVGSGTTVLSAAALGREAFGCDVDQKAIDVCIKRGCINGH